MAADKYLVVVIGIALSLSTEVRTSGGGANCANLVLAFDASCSTSDDTKENVKDFLDMFVRKFYGTIATPGSTTQRVSQFAMLAFDNSSRKVFDFEEVETLGDIISKIRNFNTSITNSKVDCGSIISEAIDMASNDFFDSDELDTRSPNVLLLFTTGRTKPQKNKYSIIASMNRLLGKNNTHVFVVKLPYKSDESEIDDTIDQINSLTKPNYTFPYSGNLNELAETLFVTIEEVALCDALTFSGDGTLGKYYQDIPRDILIILDHSNGMKPENIIFVQECIADFVKEFQDVGDIGHNTVKFSLITYNGKSTIVMLFKDTASSTRAGTLAAINNMSITRGKNRRTDLALENANSVVFTPEGGDRPFANNVVILVTGGRTTKAKYQNNTFRAADALKARQGANAVAIYLLWIPVKRPKNLEVIQKEWKEIPSEPKDKHLKDFHELSPFMFEWLVDNE